MNEVLAIAVTLVHTIADGRQVSFQTAFAADMSREDKNAVLDDLAAMGERQQVKAERPKILKDLAANRQIVAQADQDVQDILDAFPALKAALEKSLADLRDAATHTAATEAFLQTMAPDLLELRTRRQQEFNEGFMEWTRGPHSGEYKPRGHRKSNLDRLDTAIAQAEDTIREALVDFEVSHQRAITSAEEALATAESDRDFSVKQRSITRESYAKAIEALELRLSEIDQILVG